MTVGSTSSLTPKTPLVPTTLEKGVRTPSLVAPTCAYGAAILLREQQELSDHFGGIDCKDERALHLLAQ
jgi:hypothetical protein